MYYFYLAIRLVFFWIFTAAIVAYAFYSEAERKRISNRYCKLDNGVLALKFPIQEITYKKFFRRALLRWTEMIYELFKERHAPAYSYLLIAVGILDWTAIALNFGYGNPEANLSKLPLYFGLTLVGALAWLLLIRAMNIFSMIIKGIMIY